MSFSKLTPKREMADQFLTAIDPSTKAFTFQTFDDNKDRQAKDLARVMNGSLDQHWETLCKLSSDGAGVFVTINQTDLKGRKASNITKVRSLWVDTDGADHSPIIEYFKPHLVIESSPGNFHDYHLVKNCPMDQFRDAQKQLIKIFKTDAGIHDLPRVMRLPGFPHQKVDAAKQLDGTPFMVNIVEDTSFFGPTNWNYLETIINDIPDTSAEGLPSNEPYCLLNPLEIDLTNEPSPAEVREILSYIPADDYKLWLDILMGLHDLGDHMLDLAIEWSAKSTKYQPGCVEQKWKTFTSGGGLTWSTVCAEARHHGADLSTIAHKYKKPANKVSGLVQKAAQKASEVLLTSASRNTSSVFELLTQDQRWSHVFALDELKNRCMVIAKPPFQTGDPQYFKPRPLADTDYTRVRMWIERNWGNVIKEVVVDAVNAACEEQIISPVRHYLEGLPSTDYDIEHFFEDYFGVIPENDLHRDFIRSASKLFLKQAVARAVKPGCKADIVVVLEGKQGIGKSTGLRALFGADWFKDSLPPMATKDAAAYVVGAWCIELAEMAFQSKSAIEHQKAFISRQDEKYRPAYTRTEVVYPRRCVFVATTNRDDWAIDETGNRRFLPIKTTNIDVAGLKRDRDAIWAAAYASYLQDPMWWMTDEMAAYSAEQSKSRHEADIWVELINEKMPHLEETSVREAFEVCFAQAHPDTASLDPHKIDQKDQRRMSKCLQLAGWEKSGRFTSGERRNQSRFVRTI